MKIFLRELLPIIGVISAVALPIFASAYIIVLLVRSRYKERMEIIKQGIIPEAQPKPIPNKYISLRNGILCIGIALGLITSLIINILVSLEDYFKILIAVSSVLLFLGIAYVLFFLITKNKDLEE